MLFVSDIEIDLDSGARRGIQNATADFLHERLGMEKHIAELEAEEICDRELWDVENIAEVLYGMLNNR